LNRPAPREGFVAASEDYMDPSATGAEAPPSGTELEAVAEPELPQWPMTIELRHKPIRKGNEDLNELTFREPTAMDIIRAGGNPVRIDVTELAGGLVTYSPVIDDAKMMRIIANLTGLVEPQIQKMDPRDYSSCAHRLRRFFLPEQGIW
jgi:phage FluMu protein gp41